MEPLAEAAFHNARFPTEKVGICKPFARHRKALGKTFGKTLEKPDSPTAVSNRMFRDVSRWGRMAT